MDDLSLSEDDWSPARPGIVRTLTMVTEGLTGVIRMRILRGGGKVHSEADDTSGDDDSGNGAKTNVNMTSSCVQSIPLGA